MEVELEEEEEAVDEGEEVDGAMFFGKGITRSAAADCAE